MGMCEPLYHLIPYVMCVSERTRALLRAAYL